MPPSQKNRNYIRVRVPKGTMVAWEHAGERKVSYVSVMGLGGLFVSTPQPPPTGETIKLIFELPGGDVRARAVVRDSQPGKGMGIQFVSMVHEARARLNRHMNNLVKP
jgi:PilZ domain-containing protein